MTTETTELQVFQIPAENMPGLMFKLEKLSKKSQKLIGKSIALNVLGEVRQPQMNGRVQALDDDGNLCWDIWYKVSIDAETPKIAGWTFVATIDHSADTGNIIRTLPTAGCEIPTTYRTVKPICDHCNKIRARRDTFLLRSDTTGEFKQIGRQCIRDFIGYDVTSVVAMAEMLRNATPSDSDADYGGGFPLDRRYLNVKTYMAHVSAVIRTAGWISKKDAQIRAERGDSGESTASHAHLNMFPPRGKGSEWYKRIPLIDKDFETAEAALAWGATLADKDNKSDYEYNLSVLSQETYVEGRSSGLLASLIPAFFRHSQQEFERAARRAALKLGESQYVGNVDDKIGTGKQHQIAPFEAVLYGYRSFDGQFGPTYVYSFRADNGNVFIWYASYEAAVAFGLGGIDAKQRVRVRINGGTIKKHSEYNDVKQTVLARCKIEVLEVKE